MTLLKTTLSALAILATGLTANAQVFIGGNPKAALTIEEYADFECPYCARGAKLMEDVLREYPDEVKVVFRNRPLQSHASAEVSAKAFLAVAKQGHGVAKRFYDEVFAHQDQLSARGEAYLDEAARIVGADVARMKKDISSADVLLALKNDVEKADRLRIDGTPSFMVGTEKVTGAVPYAELRETIERQLGH